MKRIIYSLKLANALTERGFKVIDTAINIKFPQYKVFYFEGSAELETAIEELTNQK